REGWAVERSSSHGLSHSGGNLVQHFPQFAVRSNTGGLRVYRPSVRSHFHNGPALEKSEWDGGSGDDRSGIRVHCISAVLPFPIAGAVPIRKLPAQSLRRLDLLHDRDDWDVSADISSARKDAAHHLESAVCSAAGGSAATLQRMERSPAVVADLYRRRALGLRGRRSVPVPAPCDSSGRREGVETGCHVTAAATPPVD